MDKSDVKKLKLLMDIDEIKSVLYNSFPFDRQKAEDIIKKHNASNLKVAVMNSPFNSDYVRFEQATDEMLKNNLITIIKILESEYYDEMSKKEKCKV